MSIIQVEDLVSYQLRSNYLNTIKDGVGERLITINDAFLNTPGFKAAGWRTNPSSRQRTHSPPIPTAITSEYFRAPAAGLQANFEEENDEGGMVTGGGNAENTFGPGLGVKRRRRREQMEEEDSSDLTDDSEDEDSRAAQKIQFAKMPIRLRSGSSPGPKGDTKNPPKMSSPVRKPGARRGSHSTVEAIKQRARRDTATSSEMSSDNDFDNSAFRERQSRNTVGEEEDGIQPVIRQQSDLLPEEMEDDSLGSYMSSGFAGSMDSQSMMDSIKLSQVEEHHVGTIPRKLATKPSQTNSPKKQKAVAFAPSSTLPALPPPRPISYIKPPQPVSMLSQQINARRRKPSMPFEKFAPFTGQGDPNPIQLRIYTPLSKASPHFDVPIRRIISDPEQGNREATVSDLIGLILWRYTDSKIEPKLTPKQLHVNRWNLRLIDDDEIDYDFPPLDRTKTVMAFANVNSRGGGGRRQKKTYDEFGLVEASDSEFEKNCQITPQYKEEAAESALAGSADDDFPPAAARKKSSVNKQEAQPQALAANRPNLNPLLTTMAKTTMQADTPAPLAKDPAARPGVQKLLRIHINSGPDAAAGQMLTLDVSTGTYLAEVLDIVCRKRGLDKAAHVLKLNHGGAVVLLDRTVGSIGQTTDLYLSRRRFGTDGPLGLAGSPTSHSPRTPMAGSLDASGMPEKNKKSKKMGGFMGTGLGGGLNLTSMHPLARSHKLDEPGSTAANYQKWTVWRKQPMRFVGMNERVVAIDGEYLHIMPGSTGRQKDEGGKATTVHFSNVVGCKQVRRHPTNFKVVIFREAKNLDPMDPAERKKEKRRMKEEMRRVEESGLVGVWRGDQPKQYEFEARTAADAAEIVEQIKKGIAPYQSKTEAPI